MRTLLGTMLAAALLAAILVPGAAPAAAQKGATSCKLTTHDQRHLGASYVTSLAVKGTSCRQGKKSPSPSTSAAPPRASPRASASTR